MRRLRPWQWLVLLLVLYLGVAEAARLWLGLLWAERLMVLAAALGVWAFINGRFLFAGYHALVASARVRGLPLLPPPLSGERLLVLAPHPDDEVLAAGGLIAAQLDHTTLEDRRGYSQLLAENARRRISRNSVLVQYRRRLGASGTDLLINFYHQDQGSSLSLFRTEDTSLEMGLSWRF